MTGARSIAAAGGHLERCDRCGELTRRYHSCRNRHCPKCQTLAKEGWLEARRADLLPVPYCHVVFTLPHALNPLAQGHPRLIYRLLFQAAADTLQTFGRGELHRMGEVAPLTEPAAFDRFLASLRKTDRVVYAKPPSATIGWWSSKTMACAFAGKTTPTATGSK